MLSYLGVSLSVNVLGTASVSYKLVIYMVEQSFQDHFELLLQSQL
jgi:hypothetical protein